MATKQSCPVLTSLSGDTVTSGGDGGGVEDDDVADALRSATCLTVALGGADKVEGSFPATDAFVDASKQLQVKTC